MPWPGLTCATSHPTPYPTVSLPLHPQYLPWRRKPLNGVPIAYTPQTSHLLCVYKTAFVKFHFIFFNSAKIIFLFVNLAGTAVKRREEKSNHSLESSFVYRHPRSRVVSRGLAWFRGRWPETGCAGAPVCNLLYTYNSSRLYKPSFVCYAPTSTSIHIRVAISKGNVAMATAHRWLAMVRQSSVTTWPLHWPHNCL